MQEKEYKITYGLTVVANGQSAVQVTLPAATGSMIFLIKFKSASSAEEFLIKVKSQPGEFAREGSRDYGAIRDAPCLRA